VLADTWEWDGANWLQRLPAQSPPPRWAHALAYDAVHGRTVLFGGANSTFIPSAYGDTWEWDGSNWFQRVTSPAPSARFLHALAYDSARGRTVLFAGIGASDTWEWDGGTWTLRSPATNPAARSGHALAFDSLRRR